jgi:CheY-like chemotaxis protein
MSMIVHVVEDSALKASNICTFFAHAFPTIAQPEVSGSFQSAMRAIMEMKPDLIIMDMTIPTFDRKPNAREGRMRPIGGYDLMCKMKHRAILASVIVVTQLETFGEGDEEVSFSEITSRCEREFPDLFLGSVYYDQSGLSWQADLEKLVSSLLSKGAHQ